MYSYSFNWCDSVIFFLWFRLCSPLRIPEDQWHPPTEQTEQKTKVTGRWEKCITDSRGDPNWCVGWIMHLSQSSQSCKFAEWQWSKLSLEGMVLRVRLKWLRECKREHQRGREELSVSCRILSWLVLHLHLSLFIPLPILAIQIGWITQCGNSCHSLTLLPSKQHTAGINPYPFMYILQCIVRSLHHTW